MRGVVLLSVLLLGACDTRVSAKDYNQACTANADCVVVSEVEFCNPCGRTFTASAINTAELPRYQRELDALGKSGCPPRLGPPPPCANPMNNSLPEPPPVQLQAVCNAGTCEARAP
jgi:hypothetical protein